MQKAQEREAGGFRQVDDIEQARGELEKRLRESLRWDGLGGTSFEEAAVRFQQVWWRYCLGGFSDTERTTRLKELRDGPGKNESGRDITNSALIRDHVQESIGRLGLNRRRR